MRSPAALIRHGVHGLPACREEFCVQDLLGGIRAVAREAFHLEPRLIRRERERPGVVTGGAARRRRSRRGPAAP